MGSQDTARSSGRQQRLTFTFALLKVFKLHGLLLLLSLSTANTLITETPATGVQLRRHHVIFLLKVFAWTKNTGKSNKSLKL